ncbi:uncharacterized protein BX664DRAFT_382710 [Halteromyces radiatus]|uniref:uncharacterized protein n=1 Tax=Halteromyces radiatus TaxID=101107 RepID=UPI00222106F5|nr:uncharacterized protein BX664DRAFT_382710 [Halteromyces radiatus]KAI8096234.1 hypothetical protein BX664DRAFT_382710 [Halteromyces radiatus]
MSSENKIRKEKLCMMIKLLAICLAIIINTTFAQIEPQYHIKSVKTGTFLVNDSMTADQPLQLGDAVSAVPWTIVPPPGSSSITNSTIYDEETGLYAGLESPIVPGAKLTAVIEPYYFLITNLTSSPDSFILYPPGQNYYWFANASIGSNVEVEHAEDIKGGDLFFAFESTS